MLEFLEGDELKDCFTFSVPPESEEFDFPQRVAETKTFGGSVFDDYGNDTYRITINGSTVNEEKKVIYRGNKTPLYLTGTKEVFELQRIIRDWAANKNVTDPNKKKVYLYDLSKASVLQLSTGVASRNYWRVFIKDLKIKRDKSRPMTFKYTLDMVAVEDEQRGEEGFFGETASKKISGIQSVMDSVSAIMDITEGAMSAVAEISDHCRRVKLAYDMVKNRDFTGNLIALNVGSAADLTSRIMGGEPDNFYNSAKNLLHSITVFGGLLEDNSDTAGKGKIQSNEKYYVTFDPNGGSSIPRQQVEYGGTVIPPTDPILADYIFDGWFLDSGLTQEYDFATEVTSNLILYAKWVLRVATVTFVSRNGSSVMPQKVNVGESAIVPTPPTRDGYAFDKWYADYACTQEYDWASTVESNFTLYAGWIKTYNIVFNSNGGSAVETQTVTTGGLAVYPKTPTKENYVFAYWCADSDLQNAFDFATPITKDITLYALWVQLANTVTFNSQGGSAVESQRVVIGGYATKPATDPTREGYDFVYWATDAEGTNEFRFNTTPVNANITLYAKWTETICAVTFDSDGGSAVEPQNVGYGNKAIFPAIPTKDGYSFEMWQTKKDVEVEGGETEWQYEEFDFGTPITEDITLYALWFGGE